MDSKSANWNEFMTRHHAYCRSAAVATLALVGAAFLGQLNGQTFTNGLVAVACLLAILLLCLPPMIRGDQPWPVRRFWAAIGLTIVVAIAAVALRLPTSYRFQNRFNDRFEETVQEVSKTMQKASKM
jgi:hypothetical protein